MQVPVTLSIPKRSFNAEFKSLSFFPNNAVEYFVSYFDFYQPEVYIPRTDTFIEKDSSVNDDIERMRLSTMAALFTRHDGGIHKVLHLLKAGRI